MDLENREIILSRHQNIKVLIGLGFSDENIFTLNCFHDDVLFSVMCLVGVGILISPDRGKGQLFAFWVILIAILWSADFFFQNELFQKLLSGIPSKRQRV